MIEKLRTFTDNVRRVSHSLTDEHKKTYFVSLLFMFLSSILELFTLGLFIPFVGIVVSPSLLLQYSWSRSIISNVETISPVQLILIMGGIVFSMFIAKNAVGYLLYSYYNRYIYSIATVLSRRKMNEYYSLDFVDFQKSNIAEQLREIAYIPVEFAQHIILGSMTVLSETMILIVFAAAIALYQPSIFFMMACILLPFAFLAWYISVRILRTTKKTIQETSPLNLKRLSDALSGYQEATLYKKERFFIDRYISGQQKLNVQLGKLNAANVIPGRLSEVFAIAGIMLILFLDYSIEGRFTTSALSLLTIFVTFAYRGIPSINKILNAVAHMHTYSFTIDLIPPVRDTREPRLSPSEPYAHFQFTKTIELREVIFSYPGRKAPLLNNISFRIRKGEKIGLIGRSGSGKTTFLRILLQLLKQTSGSIFVDGKLLVDNDIPSWRTLFGYVSNESVILSDTIVANVAYGIPQPVISLEKVDAALRKVGLGDFLEQLPEGIYTEVGEQGKQMSAGQKQRLIIARALYRDADVFIFDEAMSQLDAVSEQDVLDTISSLHRDGKTIIIVSHRQRTLEGCKNIYSLKHGKLRMMPNSSRKQKMKG